MYCGGPLRTPDCGQEAAMELPTLHPQTATFAALACLQGRTCAQPQRPAPQWAWPRCCSAQFISYYSVSNLRGVFVKLSQGDQRLLPKTHTSQKSQGRDILHRPSCILELICPQSHTPRLLQVPDGEWKQMAAPDRVGAQSCLAPGVQVLHSLIGLRLHL